MATETLKVQCPSCDAAIAAKQSQVGKKIECPKCKNRFLVEAVAGVAPVEPKGSAAKKPPKKPVAVVQEDDEQDDAPTPTKKGGKKKIVAKSGGNIKVLIGAGIGVLALSALLAGGVFILNGNDGGGNQAKTTPPQKTPAQSQAANPQPGTEDTGKGPQQEDPNLNVPGENPGDPKGTPPPNTPEENPAAPVTGAQNPAATAPAKPAEPAAPKAKSAGVDLTNLLPGGAKSVFHARLQAISDSAPALRSAFFDRANLEMFERSFKFRATELTEVIHSYVGADRLPFVLMRTKNDLETGWLNQLENVGKPEVPVIQGKYLYRYVLSNPFVTAVEATMNVGDFLGIPVPGIKAKEVEYAIGLYDASTIVIAEKSLLERFFKELSPQGFPPYKTEYREVQQVKPADDAAPGVGGGPADDGAPGIVGVSGGSPMASRGSQPGAGDGNPLGQSGVPKLNKKIITSNPTYRTVEAPLKKAMNTLQDDDEKNPTALAFAELVDQRGLNAMSLKDLGSSMTSAMVMNVMGKLRVLGLAVTKMNNLKGNMVAYLDYSSDAEAKKALEENLIPPLNILKLYYLARFREPLTIYDADGTSTGNNEGADGTGAPGFPTGGFPQGSGGLRPGGPPAVGGGLSPLGAPSSPGGGKGSKDPDASSPTGNKPGNKMPRGKDSDADDAQSPGGLSPLAPPGMNTGSGRPPGFGSGPPSGMGGPPGSGYPGMPGGASPGSQPQGSRIGYSRSDTTVILTAEFSWTKDGFDTVLALPIQRNGSILRGKMAMFSGEATLFNLARRDIDGKVYDDIVKKTLAKDGVLPTAALPRTAGRERVPPGGSEPLPYGPEDRCSFFVHLLKYMDNRGSVYSKIDTENTPWYNPKNLEAAEAWIPELLVPDYPASAWRASSDLILDGRSVGATNYVALSGVGLDAARYDPKNSAQAKKVGLLGYDFTSKFQDVTDGLSNTAFLIQVPPGLDRPWIAGGGATAMGVDERGNDPARPFLHKRADGSRTTTVLMGDGSVRTIREGVNADVFRALATRAGGEKIAELDKVAPIQLSPKKRQELRVGQ